MLCCYTKDVNLRLNFHTDKDRDFISMELVKLSKLLIETPSSWMVPRVPACQALFMLFLVWFLTYKYFKTVLMFKIYFSRRNVYIVCVCFFACFVRLETLQNWKCILRVINLPQMFPLSQFKIPSIQKQILLCIPFSE